MIPIWQLEYSNRPVFIVGPRPETSISISSPMGIILIVKKMISILQLKYINHHILIVGPRPEILISIWSAIEITLIAKKIISNFAIENDFLGDHHILIGKEMIFLTIEIGLIM